MTGEKNRYKTLETLVKIDDKTLKTPEHDELILYLLNKENIKRLIPEVIEKLNEEVIVNFLQYNFKYGEKLIDILGDTFWDKIKGESLSVEDIIMLKGHSFPRMIFRSDIDLESEYVNSDGTLTKKLQEEIYNQEGVLIESLDTRILDDKGIFQVFKKFETKFDIDAMEDKKELVFFMNKISRDEINSIKSCFDELRSKYKSAYDSFKQQDFKILSEVPVVNPSNNFLLFYIDIKVEFLKIKKETRYFTFRWKNPPEPVFIEVKPKIASFGETLRQINTYKEYTGSEKFYLFTPDLRFKEQFEAQGVTVISPPQKQQKLI